MPAWLGLGALPAAEFGLGDFLHALRLDLHDLAPLALDEGDGPDGHIASSVRVGCASVTGSAEDVADEIPEGIRGVSEEVRSRITGVEAQDGGGIDEEDRVVGVADVAAVDRAVVAFAGQ